MLRNLHKTLQHSPHKSIIVFMTALACRVSAMDHTNEHFWNIAYYCSIVLFLPLICAAPLQRINETVSGDLHCPNGTHSCDAGQRCLPIKWQCNGRLDCHDGSDESGCSEINYAACKESEYACEDGGCIPFERRCDLEKDCPDGSDEEPAVCIQPCPRRYWKCQNSNQCIRAEWKCDGQVDCPNGEDELPANCKITLCPEGKRMCADQLACIKEHQWCDGNPDCADTSDEVNENCRSLVTIPPTTPSNKSHCAREITVFTNATVYAEVLMDCLQRSTGYTIVSSTVNIALVIAVVWICVCYLY